MKQVNIGVCNGLTCLVDNGTLIAGFCFLYALHENLPSVFIGACSDADGIKADYLLNGFRQVLVLYSCSDTEVLQFVVEEVDGVACLLLCELVQSIGERHIIIFT